MNIYIYIPNKIILVCNLSSILMTGSVDCLFFFSSALQMNKPLLPIRSSKGVNNF